MFSLPICRLATIAVMTVAAGLSAAQFHSSFIPIEDTNASLHNPDMGWVVYENYPIDPTPGGSSTLVTMPGDSFPEADAVAIMFSWADVEAQEGVYNFTNVDFAYDYWKKFGKEIQLRMSTEPLMLHVPGKPLAGTGVPPYVLNHLSGKEKQTRHMNSEPYLCVDARNRYYQQRLKQFLKEIGRHFDASRPVTLIDLRGFGAWGEWHSGFHYPSLAEKRGALKTVLNIWSETLSDHLLALSFSYDPDSPKSFYAGPYDKLDRAFTTNYSDFVRFSGFDYALRKPNITWRRDGCGGAVHSNERLLNEEAFTKYHQAPIVAEFLGSYSAIKKGGSNWVTFAVKDALSLHPNYLNLIGWQAGEARYFSKERPDLLALGSQRMGYRFVPSKVDVLGHGHQLDVRITWENRGCGRALRDYEVVVTGSTLKDGPDGAAGQTFSSQPQKVGTSTWIRGAQHQTSHRLRFSLHPLPSDGAELELSIQMRDPRTTRNLSLPLASSSKGSFRLGICRCAVKPASSGNSRIKDQQDQK